MKAKKAVSYFTTVLTVISVIGSFSCIGVHASETKGYYNGSKVTDGNYVIEDSDTETIDSDSLKYLTADQLRIARNEICAREGRKFKDESLQEYFEAFTWYNGTISPEAFDEQSLSATEKANLTVIQDAEECADPDSEFVIEDSDSVYLDEDELIYLTGNQLRIARNEIFARYGRKFNDTTLQNYFNSCSWYEGTIAPDDFNESVLNNYEKANVKLIIQVEEDRENCAEENTDTSEKSSDGQNSKSKGSSAGRANNDYDDEEDDDFTDDTEKSTGSDSCTKCHGSGDCQICDGEGYSECSGWYCENGRCGVCDGSGRIYSLDNSTYERCNYCSGGNCRVCHGTGKIKCSICHGSGNCNKCGGDGKK